MTLEEIKKYKKLLGYSNEQMADLSGIALGTVQKVFGGATKAPRHNTLKALSEVFTSDPYCRSVIEQDRNKGSNASSPYQSPMSDGSDMVREASPMYGNLKSPVDSYQDGHTLKDYYAMSDDRRIELIDGVIYDMASPSAGHQIIAMSIANRFCDFVYSKGGDCIPLIAPIDVQLDCDEKTMVQPDVLVVCDKTKVIKRGVYGPPDLIVEIVSPHSRRHDMIRKLNKYEAAGVREYWIVDPDQDRILVFDFAGESYPAIYSMESKVPVGIWEGKCQVDFSEIKKRIMDISK